MKVTPNPKPETEQRLLMPARERGKGINLPSRPLGDMGSLRRRDIYDNKPQGMLETGRGLLDQYGPAPSADEIDANRRDMFGGSARDAGEER